MYQKRIEEVTYFINSNDIELGFRRLLDCVLDTQQMSLYKEAIVLTDFKYSTDFNVTDFKEKAFQLLEKTASIELIPAERNTVVSANQIEKTYRNHNFTLGPVTTEIKKGDVFGLVGENGNGKTTLLRILAKELSYDKGEILYNFNHQNNSNYDLRTKLIYIPQRTQKWHGSLMDNLKFVLSNYQIPANEIETRVLLMVARFGLWEYKSLKWSELSSGYKMRFELVRSMLRQPEVLLLDEPLANLDILAQQVVLEDLKSIGRSVTNPIAIILSSQQLYEVEKISNKVIFLKKGKQQRIDNTENTNVELIIEIETNCSKTELHNCFSELNLTNLTFNGGMFFAYFDEKITFNNVMTTIVKHNIEVNYLRNISKSTRRFFVD